VVEVRLFGAERTLLQLPVSSAMLIITKPNLR
jgi:hypothetical protein